MQRFNRLSSCFARAIGISLFFFLPATLQPLCVIGPDPYRIRSFTFSTYIRDAPDLSFLFLNFREMYDRYGGEPGLRQLTNAEEWRERFCEIPRKEDIERLLYRSTLGELEFLRTAVMGRDIALTPSLANNSFARYLKRHQCEETARYLVYAKRCEPHVLPPADPWKPAPRNTEVMQALIEEGRQTLEDTESHYIRLRYLYQIIRLAHYSAEHERVLDLFETLRPRIDNDPSIIEYWILGHYAGALQALGRNVEAAYHYARVFAFCPGKRESALRSYRIRTDQEWEQCLLMARNREEQAALYALRGFGPKARRAEEMRAIYELDPTNPFLESLLVREIKDLEPLLEVNLPDQNYRERYLESLGDRAVVLLQLTRLWANAERVKRPELWRMAQGYLEVLTGDTYAAARTFARLKGQVKDRELKKQFEVWDRIRTIASWQKPTADVEEQAFQLENRDDYFAAHPDAFRDLLLGRLSLLYQQNEKPAKAFLTRYPLTHLYVRPEAAIVEDLLRLTRKDDKNLWERDLTSISGVRDLEKQMILLQSMNYFGEFRLEAALETLKEINPAEWNNYGRFDPFVHRLRDCVNCTVRDTSRQRYNRGELLQKLLDLEYEARGKPETAARNYFLLGLAHYNITYFGPSWRVLDRFRSSSSIRREPMEGDNIYFHALYPNGNREYMDCSQALFYFDRARQLAEDPELAARATFWAAKCEQNAYFSRKERGAEQSFTYFEMLRDRYGETDFFVRAIRECQYFEAFLTR